MTAFPKTLLQLAGASPAPSPLADSALVLIDAQLEYVCGAVPLAGIDAAVAQAVRLLGMARARDVPVFHIVHLGKARAAAFDPLGWHVAIIPELVPVEGEKVVVKSLPNAFAGTTLDEAIRATGRRELIIAGFATHMCVSATTRAALDLGYRCTVVAGATATRDLPNPLGRGVTPAAVVQEGTLAALADRFAVIVPDADALERADRASIELNAGARSCG
jgi:nicotinamidase-related amidase